LPTGQASAFKAAGIQASVVTDANGNQELAFTSANSAFEVQATDRTSNALLGNFAADGSSAATGAQMGTTVTSSANAVGANFSTNNVTLTFSGAGFASPKTLVLNTDLSADTDSTALAAALQTLGTAAGLGITFGSTTLTGVQGQLTFASTAGAGAITVSASGAGMPALGMSANGTSAGTSGTAGTTYSNQVSGGAFEMASTASGSTAVSNMKWGGAITGTNTQSISLTAADSTGASHPITINLDSTSGATVASAVGKINDTLQKSNDATLQQITAVAVNDNGVTKINFVSTLPDFSVALGKATSASALGITDASGNQGDTTQALQVGSGGTADISTVSGAQAAVTAISNAVSALGSAQAGIGIGENQVNYAVNLAQSQITNLSAAESQIRDANVAQQAANLSKAQVLTQASIAAMAQANSAPQAVLSLLRG
jgi:flagellin